MNTKICLVALGAYPLLAGGHSERVIGPSVHQVLLARELIKHNFDVALITYNEGGPPVEYIDGMEVVKTYREGCRLNSAFKALCLWKAMRRAKADIYYDHGGAVGAGGLYCWLARRKFVWHIAHDKLVGREPGGRKLVERLGCWLDRKLAHALVVQSEFQGEMLSKNFGKDSVLIRNHFPLTERGLPQKAQPRIALWVGAMADMKQPELFLKLAEAIPQGVFQMIGGVSNDQGLYDRVKDIAAKLPNLEFSDVVPLSEINEYYGRAAILVNTAKAEGFPYAFVQAWMNYTPVVSLNSDPDEIICRHKTGLHSKTFERLIDDVKLLLDNEGLCRDMGESGRRYVEQNHDINSIVKQHIEVFNRVARSK